MFCSNLHANESHQQTYVQRVNIRLLFKTSVSMDLNSRSTKLVSINVTYTQILNSHFLLTL